MATITFHKVSTLPGTPVANAIYFVENGTYSETYVTNSAGTARSLGNSAMINALADARIASALADLNLVEVAADITARNALAGGRNLLVMVIDATGDATVASGSALYVYRETTTTWVKVAEYESMDVTLAWANITGRPASAVSLIDDAVTKRHDHTNKTYLDKIGESAGALTYDGSPVGGSPQWTTTNW